MDKYQLLLDGLKKAKDDNCIILLHRGVSTKFAFEKVSLDIKHNTFEQFAERLFFFGEKSKYFWNQKINSAASQLQFGINDTTDVVFEYIFKEFNSLIKNHNNKGTSYYFKRNKKATLFFNDLNNLKIFVCEINQQNHAKKTIIRNAYLTILHQLGESKFKKSSQFISSSTDEKVADKFSKDEIVINFWELNFNNDNMLHPNNNIPIFRGKPYRNQKELSVFTVILPHFIYSFKFKNEVYKNPAIDKIVNFNLVPFTGLEIDQANFTNKLKEETNYSGGVLTNGSIYEEI